ncbi:aspartate aminotransferase, mitochondrial-like [Onthophagus taurus]|uniref:aspartate aminotransferase, mitochondrial-like n=1 Tax=Onthophagus taurus TaxID=166361 RepID=UPI0039BE33BC
MASIIRPVTNFLRKQSILKQITRTALWSEVQMAIPDPMFDLKDKYLKCTSKKKVNLVVDGYQNDYGKSFVFTSVQKAEKLLHSMKLYKEYSPILGDDNFHKLCLQLVLGEETEYTHNGMISTLQTVAGTGAMRMGLIFIQKFFPGKKTVYLSNPIWNVFPTMCKWCGLNVGSYRYYDLTVRDFDYTGLIEDISKLENAAVVFFYASAHFPTGLDPAPAQWDEIINIVKKKKLLPLFFLHCLGLASGNIDTDAFVVRKFVQEGIQCMWALSLSKTMGLYGERVGQLAIITRSEEETQRINSQLKILVRGVYSSPPVNGSRIAMKILEDSGLRADWQSEIREMSDRISDVRKALAKSLHEVGSKASWEHLTKPVGLASMTGFTADQCERLVTDFSVYLPSTGQMMFGGINTKNIEYIARCFHEVTK